MVARLKLKEIDGRAPPGVDTSLLQCKALLLKVDPSPLFGAGVKRLLVCACRYLSGERGRYHRIAGKS